MTSRRVTSPFPLLWARVGMSPSLQAPVTQRYKPEQCLQDLSPGPSRWPEPARGGSSGQAGPPTPWGEQEPQATCGRHAISSWALCTCTGFGTTQIFFSFSRPTQTPLLTVLRNYLLSKVSPLDVAHCGPPVTSPQLGGWPVPPLHALPGH